MKRPLVVAMKLDLDDLASVKDFSKQFMKRYKRLDILVNNAGLIAEPGSLTAQGLEQSFGAMHICHFALTKYLLKLLLKPVPGGRGVHDSARVVNLAADAMFAGNFHPSLMTGTGGGDLKTEITDNCGFVNGIECCPFLACPNTNGYARAKLAGALHAYELQRRVDDLIAQQSGGAGGSKSYRRLVTASLHPGSVSTGIHGFLSSQLTAMFLRSSDQAGHVLLHAILDDSFIPSSYIDAMRVSHDLFNYRDLHLQRHYSAFPQARSLPFASAPDHKNRITLHSVLWSRQKLIYAQQAVPAQTDSPVAGSAEVEEGEYYRKDSVAARLWDVSEQIVSDWEAKRPLFMTNVSTSSGPKLKL
jgi:NAD(P)-dependent dehydrogenase (short-subunit alcohol dehydrogenase family)